jgi:uncharacterized protein
VLTNTRTILTSLGAPGAGVLLAVLVVLVAWVGLIGWSVRQERASRRAEAQIPVRA